jgi:hypothetical protein
MAGGGSQFHGCRAEPGRQYRVPMADVSWLELIIPAGAGVFGAVVGSLGTFLGQERANADAARRDDAQRLAARQAAAIAERREYEVTTYSRLPELVRAHARMVMVILLADQEGLHNDGRLPLDTPAGGEEGLQVASELMLVTNRVLDDDVRERVHRARRELSDLSHYGTFQTIQEHIGQIDHRMERLQRIADETLDLVATQQRALYRNAPRDPS